MKLQRKEELATYRKSLFNSLKQIKPYKILPQNIIVLYVDAISRVRILKKLQKTMKWLEQKSQELNQSHAFFQSFRYQSLSIFTYHNYMAYEYGIVSNEQKHLLTASWTYSNGYNDAYMGPFSKDLLKRKKAKWKSLTYEFQEAGYMVAKARSQCSNSVVDHDPSFEIFVQIAPPDHELASMMCDPNYQYPENPFGPFQGPYSTLRRCLYGREISDYVFDYGRQFLKTYSDSPKYLELQFLEGHESSGEHIKNLDAPLEKFLLWLDQEQMVNNSMIMIVSDHGLHIHALYELLNLDNYQIEKVLPALFILIDKRFFNKFQLDNLIENQQKLITFFEVRYLMRFLIQPTPTGGNEQNSLISPFLQNQRDCTDLPIPPEVSCFCYRSSQF